LLTIATALVAVTAVPALLFGPEHSQAQEAPAAPPAVPVSVATVESRAVVAWDEYAGRLEAVDRVELRSEAAGRVQAVHFREGALVKKGELLVTIDPAVYAAEVQRARANLTAAQTRVRYTRSELERAQRLWSDHAIAQRELDERDNAARESEANLAAAQAALRSAQLDLDHTEVRSPINGRIGRIDVTPGNLVAAGPGSPVLTTIVSVNPMYASFEADESALARALANLRGSTDQPAARPLTAIDSIPVQLDTTGTFGGGQPVQGHLQLVNNEVDARSGTVRLRAVFDNADGRLMPGQYARLRMGQAQPSEALLIADRAIGTDQDKRYVIVVGDGDKAAWREVQLGGTIDGLRVVRDGLKPGERIVVNGLQRVRPGMQVAPQPVAMRRGDKLDPKLADNESAPSAKKADTADSATKTQPS